MSGLSREPIILASGSFSRKAMLDAVGAAYEAIPADIDERGLEAEMSDSAPAEIAQALAAAKAAAVSAQHPAKIVLGSDSLVDVGGTRFDKPESREQAAEHLRSFSGQVMTLHSAAALAQGGQIMWVGGDFARLKFRELSDVFIETYLEAEWPEVAGCVGVFRIEAAGPHLFESIVGDQFTVLGMPLLQVMSALRDQGAIAS
ncbi:Maf family protein [Erythrobacter sp. W53]|uniref:Maf family protein n=1 Tax=Erythrobacter sp. W53 TaxID=3425947 RepID=UPI003D76889E